MEKILLSKEKKQYKANLHCHSVLSDGKQTPEELVRDYQRAGYDILAITDHCRPKSHADMTTEDFLLLTGYEAYIRTTNGKYDAFAPEVHLNLFAREPENEKYICYNKGYCKYVPEEEHDRLDRVGSERPREYTTEYVNEFIRTANENGYLVSYNHPFWSMESEERIMSYENCFSLELYNTSSYTVNHLENAEMLYDAMLRRGIRMGCHGGDDNHKTGERFGGHTMILSDRLEYGAVVDALDKKEFYASTGPRIHEIRVYDGEEGKKVHVECSPAQCVYLFFGSKSPKRVVSKADMQLVEADLDLHPDARFIRVVVYDKDGNVANSRGYFPDEWSE